MTVQPEPTAGNHALVDPDAVEPGRHILTMAVLYRLTDEQYLAALNTGVVGEEMGPDQLVDIHIGCYACDQPMDPGLLESPCPGPVEERAGDELSEAMNGG